MVVDVLSSIHSAYALQISRLTEQNYLYGSDYFAASIDQAFQANEALKTLNMVFKEMNRGVLPRWASNAVLLSPLLPASLIYVDIGNLWVKKTVIWVTEHFGQTTRATNILGTVLLFFYGRHYVALASFATYAVSYMSEKKYFSDHVNKIIDAAIVIPIDIYLLVYGSFLDRIISVLEVAARVKRTLAQFQETQREESLPTPSKRKAREFLGLQDLDGMCLDRVSVDYSHLDDKQVGSVEESYSYCEESLNRFEEEFEKINWGNHINVMLMGLAKDPHWNDPSVLPESLFKDAQELKDLLLLRRKLSINEADRKQALSQAIKPHAIQFVREGIQIFTYRLKARTAQVRDEKVSFNEPKLKVRQKRNSAVNLSDLSKEDYISRVEGHYHSIASSLFHCETEMERADALLKLGIEAADYCGPQFTTVLAETQASVAKIGKDMTLQQGILKILHERRVAYIVNIWGEITKYIPENLVQMLGLTSPHWPNVILTLHGKALNAETIGSENDIEAKSTVTEGIALLMMPFTWLFQYSFLANTYTKENILEWVKEEIKSGRIGLTSITNWYQENQYLSSFEMLYNMDEDDYSNITIKDEALIYMLVKMGVLAPDHILSSLQSN